MSDKKEFEEATDAVGSAFAHLVSVAFAGSATFQEAVNDVETVLHAMHGTLTECAIEAAMKMRGEYMDEKHSNGAKMREAVEQMEVSNVKTHAIFSKFTEETLDAVNKIYDLVSKPCVDLEDVFQACQQARAILYNPPVTKTPPRNCDVGTAEEQYERYRSQCRAQDCCDCPVRKKWDFGQTGRESCQLVWAQMPYEEGGAE